MLKLPIGDIYMKNRSELREIIMRILYQINILKGTKIDYDIKSIIDEQLEIESEYVNNAVNYITENYESMSIIANKYLKDWTLDRLSKVDQAILLLGIYELTETKTPSIVSINEAIELSKKYSEEKVTKMINGVLDNIYHSEDK